MIQQVITLLIGIIGGISVGIQTPMSNAIARRVGSASSSFIVHATGTIYSGILLLALRGEDIRNVRNVPWWMFIVGLFGMILYLTINYTIPRLGATAAIALIIVGQLVAGMVIDQFGLLETPVHTIDATRIIAVILLVVGGYLMAK